MLSRAEWDTYSDEEKFQYVQLGDKDNEDMRKVLELIPECPAHGFCLPHMTDWIKARKHILEKMEQDELSNLKRFTS